MWSWCGLCKSNVSHHFSDLFCLKLRFGLISASIIPLIPAFAMLLARAASCQAITLAVTVHYTRASAEQSLSQLPIGMRIVAGRPNLKSALDNVVKRTESTLTPENKTTGVYVGVCGPAGLVEDAWRAEAALEGDMKKKVGGVELHEE